MADSFATGLKDAITAGDFERGKNVAMSFSEQIKIDLRCRPAPEREAAFEYGVRHLREALTLGQIMRSHLSLRLAALQAEQAYHSDCDADSWSVNG